MYNDSTFMTTAGQEISHGAVQDAMTEHRISLYSMALVGKDACAVEAAVNQGIDAHLEACFVPDRGDSYEWKAGLMAAKLHCKVGSESLPVLLRRLYETEGDLEEAASGLADGIFDTLELGEY